MRDQFTDLTQRAMRDYVRERVNERLKSALETDKVDGSVKPVSSLSAQQDEAPVNDGIETTTEELEGYRIVQAVGAELVDPERIEMRDAKSYCAVLLDDNNRRPICRFHFGKTKNIRPTRRMPQSDAGPPSRRRFYSKENTLWAFLSQIIDAGHRGRKYAKSA